MSETQKHSSGLSWGQIAVVVSVAAAVIGLISDSMQLIPRVELFLERLIGSPAPVAPHRDPPQAAYNPGPEARPPDSAPIPRVEPIPRFETVFKTPPPMDAAPVQRAMRGLSRHEISIDFQPYASASARTGAEIASIDRQSRLKGLLCAGDAVLEIDGAQLIGKDGSELHDDFVGKLGASADFVIHFKPSRRSKDIEWDASGQFGIVRGRDIREGRANRRDC